MVSYYMYLNWETVQVELSNTIPNKFQILQNCQKVISMKLSLLKIDCQPFHFSTSETLLMTSSLTLKLTLNSTWVENWAYWSDWLGSIFLKISSNSSCWTLSGKWHFFDNFVNFEIASSRLLNSFSSWSNLDYIVHTTYSM